MDVAIHDITEVEKEISIQVAADELVPHFEEAYKRYQPKLELKGFRKGRVPLEMVKKMYGEQIEYESLGTVATDFYRQAVKEKEIRPVGEPVLVDMNYKRGELLAFKIKYEVLPSFTLGEYKGIKVEKLIHKVTDEEVEDEITRIRRANAIKVEVQTADDDEHIVTADIQDLDETGFPMIGKKSENQQIYLGDQGLVREFKEALRAASVGTSRRVRYETQPGHHTHRVHVQISVKKVEKIQLPELDDALVQKITKDAVKTVDEFKERLRKDIEDYWAERSERRILDDLAGEIVRRHDFAVPESLVQGLLTSQLEDLKSRFPNRQLPADFDEQKYREEHRASAILQTKWLLLRERIIEAEGMTVEESEIEKLAEEKVQQTGIEKEKLVEYFKKSEETQRRLLSDKLISFLKSQTKITEKVTDEFF